MDVGITTTFSWASVSKVIQNQFGKNVRVAKAEIDIDIKRAYLTLKEQDIILIFLQVMILPDPL